MIIVSKQLSAEYRQVYYERTSFFLRIDHQNLSRGIPHLAKEEKEEVVSQPPVPNFWGASKSLFENLRYCTLYIELSSIEKAQGPVSQRAGWGWHRKLNDTDVTTSIQTLIRSMRQIRTIHIVCDTNLRRHASSTMAKDLKQTCVGRKPYFTAEERRQEYAQAIRKIYWNTFIRPFADLLMSKRSLRKFRIKIGDAAADLELSSEAGQNGQWPSLSADDVLHLVLV